MVMAWEMGDEPIWNGGNGDDLEYLRPGMGRPHWLCQFAGKSNGGTGRSRPGSGGHALAADQAAAVAAEAVAVCGTNMANGMKVASARCSATLDSRKPGIDRVAGSGFCRLGSKEICAALIAPSVLTFQLQPRWENLAEQARCSECHSINHLDPGRVAPATQRQRQCVKRIKQAMNNHGVTRN